MLAADVMGSLGDTITAALPLKEAMEIMEQLDSYHMVVLDDNSQPVGVLDAREVKRKLQNHIIEHQKHCAV